MITYDTTFTYKNLRQSAKDCTKGVKWKASVQSFAINNLQWVASLYNDLKARKYKSKGFHEFWIKERGKMRHIQSVHISERTVQKCLCQYGLKPIVEPRLIYDNGASRRGKGTQFAIKRLRRHLSEHYRKHGQTGGILLLDIHGYFNSIPHDRLLAKYRAVVKDDELFNMTVYFTDCYGEVGLGLGSELSQLSAIFYLSDVDHHIKEKLHIKGYGRYMDDMYLIHEDVEYLKKCLSEIEKMLEELGLRLNPKTQIIRFEHGSFTYLKRRFTITQTGKVLTRLMRPNITKRRRTLKRQMQLSEEHVESVEQSYQSWRGYAKKWDSYKTVCNMDSLHGRLVRERKQHGRPH